MLIHTINKSIELQFNLFVVSGWHSQCSMTAKKADRFKGQYCLLCWLLMLLGRTIVIVPWQSARPKQSLHGTFWLSSHPVINNVQNLIVMWGNALLLFPCSQHSCGAWAPLKSDGNHRQCNFPRFAWWCANAIFIVIASAMTNVGCCVAQPCQHCFLQWRHKSLWPTHVATVVAERPASLQVLCCVWVCFWPPVWGE